MILSIYYSVLDICQESTKNTTCQMSIFRIIKNIKGISVFTMKHK